MTATLSAPPIWNETRPGQPAGEPSFYTKLFGWKSTDVDMGPMGRYAMFEQNSPNVGGIVRVKSPEWDGLPPHWAIYVQVDNVDTRAEKATQLGGTVCVPPFDIPDVGRACIVLDPEGASFYLFAPTRIR